MNRYLCAAGFALCAACGDGTTASANAVNGTVSGFSLKTRDGVSLVVQNGPSVSFAIVMMTSIANVCPVFTDGHMLRNDETVLLRLATRTQEESGPKTFPPSLVGDYPVVREVSTPVSGKFAILDFVIVDANCTAAEMFEPDTGKVTLTRIDDSGYTGSFDVTFTGGDHLTGTFDTSTCAALVPGSTPKTCR